MEKVENFIKLVSVQTKPESLFIFLVLLIRHTKSKHMGGKIGTASATGYSIKFKTLTEINIDILEAAIRYGLEAE